MSQEWIQCNFNAYPRMQHFVAVEGGAIVGCIHYTQKSGFRTSVVLELEQLAVLPNFQDRGFGRQLIIESLPFVRTQLANRGATLRSCVKNPSRAQILCWDQVFNPQNTLRIEHLVPP